MPQTMVGALLTLLLCLACAGLVPVTWPGLISGLNRPAQVGLSGLIGLGLVGLITLPIGLIPGGLHWGQFVIFLVAIVGLFGLTKLFKKSEEPAEKFPLWLGAIWGLIVLIALVGALAPADTVEWDSLAYHLAVPKIWLQAGQIKFISFIHHSNFPFVVDNLYIWGLKWGGEVGAKLFSIGFLAYGLLAVYGIAEGLYGKLAGAWASLAFAGTPLVLWMAGTAYVDLANGLFTGLGIVFAAKAIELADRTWLLRAGGLLGFAVGSKYTGLQTVFIVGLTSLILMRPFSAGFRTGATIAGIALLIGGGWYIKNVAWTGNPVYPFFYSKLGGKNWDDFSEKIYREEQQTFGAGRDANGPEEVFYSNRPLDPTRLGGSVLGLAYQPGRYINPNPTGGNGFTIGAFGFVGLSALLGWLFAARRTKFENGVILAVGISLLLWFALSQQVRYVLGLNVALSILAAGLSRWSSWASGVQCAASIWLISGWSLGGPARFTQQLQVALGKTDRADYRRANVSFAKSAEWLNSESSVKKVALYDEVFGYLLDKDYFWANPGHTTELGYEGMKTGEELVAALKKQGITHVYINLGTTFGMDGAMIGRWLSATQDQPYSAEEEAKMAEDPRTNYKRLLADAIREGRMVQVFSDRARITYAIK